MCFQYPGLGRRHRARKHTLDPLAHSSQSAFNSPLLFLWILRSLVDFMWQSHATQDHGFALSHAGAYRNSKATIVRTRQECAGHTAFPALRVDADQGLVALR